MKIYFAGAIRGGKEKKEDYKKIIQELSKYGEVLTEHIGGKRAKKIDDVKINSLKGDAFIFERDMLWLESSDLIVADLSVTSFGVGFEVGHADRLGKDIVLIWDRKFIKTNKIKISALAKGNNKNTITKMPYSSLDELNKKLLQLLK